MAEYYIASRAAEKILCKNTCNKRFIIKPRVLVAICLITSHDARNMWKYRKCSKRNDGNFVIERNEIFLASEFLRWNWRTEASLLQSSPVTWCTIFPPSFHLNIRQKEIYLLNFHRASSIKRRGKKSYSKFRNAVVKRKFQPLKSWWI